MDQNFQAYLRGRGQGFNPYAAGKPQYPGGSPNNGPTDQPESYDERDRLGRVRRNMLLKRMQVGMSGNYNTPAWLYPGTSRSV